MNTTTHHVMIGVRCYVVDENSGRVFVETRRFPGTRVILREIPKEGPTAAEARRLVTRHRHGRRNTGDHAMNAAEKLADAAHDHALCAVLAAESALDKGPPTEGEWGGFMVAERMAEQAERLAIIAARTLPLVGKKPVSKASIARLAAGLGVEVIDLPMIEEEPTAFRGLPVA
jgi:hypothetical protein